VKFVYAFVAVLLSGFAWNPVASAQVNEKFADMAGEIDLIRSVAQTERQAIVARSMILTPEEEAAFWPLYNEYRAAMEKVNDRLIKVVTDYAAQRDTLTDQQAMALMNDHLKFEQELLRVRKQYIRKFTKALPTVKVARFYQIENTLDALQKLGMARQIPLAK